MIKKGFKGVIRILSVVSNCGGCSFSSKLGSVHSESHKTIVFAISQKRCKIGVVLCKQKRLTPCVIATIARIFGILFNHFLEFLLEIVG